VLLLLLPGRALPAVRALLLLLLCCCCCCAAAAAAAAAAAVAAAGLLLLACCCCCCCCAALALALALALLALALLALLLILLLLVLLLLLYSGCCAAAGRDTEALTRALGRKRKYLRARPRCSRPVRNDPAGGGVLLGWRGKPANADHT
jgi:hypothetical protein